jgi:transposase
MSLAYGRSKKGSPVYERKLTRTNQKLNTIAVISHQGLKTCRHYKCSLNIKQFIYFLEYFVLPILKNETLIMDRHPVHCAKEVKDFMIKHKIRFLYLPPYSPDLNPIENVFSKVKQFIKTYQPKTIDRLKFIIKLAFENVSQNNYISYFRHAFFCLNY